MFAMTARWERKKYRYGRMAIRVHVPITRTWERLALDVASSDSSRVHLSWVAAEVAHFNEMGWAREGYTRAYMREQEANE